jgi:predicted alpha/beta-fold hydrolase
MIKKSKREKVSKKFKPAFGMKNKHIQTLYSSFFRKNEKLDMEIQRITLEDGDFLDTYWYTIKNSTPTTPIAILFHGLAGSYKSPYIQGVMKEFKKAGINSVLMHFRSCSGTINNLPRSYHSGETGDALFFIRLLKKRYPDAKLYGVGYSLGGNMLLKLLGEMGEKSLLLAGVSVSAPMQLDTCANTINNGFSKIYQNHLVKNLKNSLLEKYKQHDMKTLLNFKKEDVKKIKTFWEFDEIYTAPIHGFKSAQDYYTKCSSKQFLKNIKIPTLIIHSSDDPFMSTDIIPKKNELSTYCILELYSHGGHVGFISGNIFQPEYWLEKRVVNYLSSI